MIKGCQRRMFVVKETGSPYFDCAYFVLRCDLPEIAKESDMLKEAYRMIEASCPPAALSPSADADISSDKASKPEKRAFILIALLCAVIPTAATVGIFCLLL